ncbi:MAG TPA: hypothetical protein VGQ69_16520 [Gemmatimonadales bacterium]|jgi:uncharacterized protein YoxC|nr:hypothetical protein [Gemmatimonadales bacterium]
MPGWVGPTVAISLVIIALAFAAIAAGSVLLARAAQKEIAELSDKLEGIRGDLHDAMHAVRRVAEAGEDVSGKLKEEIQHYLATSRAIRHDLERGVRRVKTRLADLDALYEVVHEEVEETALDVAAKVRSVRNGAGVVSRLRRLLVRSRR